MHEDFWRLLKKKSYSEQGQMSIEFVIAFPVMIMIACIMFNACLFLSECASFDRLSKDAIRSKGTSPAYQASTDTCASEICDDLSHSFDASYEHVDVEVETCAYDQVRYTAKLSLHPTLFGQDFSGNIFDVSISPVCHESALVVCPYNPQEFEGVQGD